jgi:poly-gamma-glutamate capsule biosynthesis protein CapA/YwtB (metallophosphatase superfamily)
VVLGYDGTVSGWRRRFLGWGLIAVGVGLWGWVLVRVWRMGGEQAGVSRTWLVERRETDQWERLPTGGLPIKVQIKKPKAWTTEEVFNGGGVEREEGEITIIAGGDVSMARAVNARLVREGGEGEVLGEVKNILLSADLATVNLEAPLLGNCPVTTEGMRLCGDDENVAGLVQAGVDAVSLANNHTRDYGEAGLRETEEVMKRSGILAIKDGGMGVKEVRGVKVGMVGFNLVGKRADERKVRETFGKAGEWAEVVIGWFHWGQEYTANPTEQQRQVAHWAIESGADLVIGSHPHWVQAVEIYQGKLIVYSLGNLVFDQLWSKETREGVVGEFGFRGNELVSVEWVPIFIGSDFKPVVADETRAEKILTRMREASGKLEGMAEGY